MIAPSAESPASRSRFTIESFATIDSTNSELKRRAENAAGAIDGHVVVTDTQTAGRGRHGREWIDQPGGSLLFSMGWTAPVAPSKLAGLSLAIGVAVAAALESDGIARVQLKWPNDLLLNHCKLGGILIETINARESSVDVIIGVGINIRIDASIRDRVSGSVIGLSDAGWNGDRESLLPILIRAVEHLLMRFSTDGFGPWRAAWIDRHALQQRNVTIWRAGCEIASGKAIDVDAEGALLLQTSAGVRRFMSGESTLRAS